MSDWSDDETTPATKSVPRPSGGGGDGGGCRNCGQDGHFARECPEKKSGGGGDGCRKCGQEGHMARDCDKPDKCNKCNEEGHMARDCSKPDTCRRCGEEGHMARDCEKPETCRRCGEEGHRVADCTQEETTRSITTKDGETREIYVPSYTADEELFNKETTISSGINFSKYENIPVKVDGENVPRVIENFAQSGMRQLVLDNVSKAGYKIPTPIQKHAIPAIKEQRDLLACAQTGSGKTAAFLLPIISNLLETGADCNSGSSCQTPQCIIMTPTRELAIQIHDQSRKFGSGSMIKTGLAYGGTSTGAQLSRLQRGCNILVATPGRLLDFVEKGKVSFDSLQYFILDEADRMLDMGFGGEIAKCANHPSMPAKENRTTLLFSATFPEEVRRSAREYLKKDRIFITIGVVGAPCADVQQTFLCVDKKEKKNKLLDIINDDERNPTERIMIFVNTKRQADFLATLLCGLKKPSTSIHGDRLQREREEALRDFRTGHRPIIVCTAVAARGLDIPEVQHVVNYDMPTNVDEYVHRVGRSGRVGNLGKATSFFDPGSDMEVQGPLVKLLQEAGVQLPDFLTGGGSDPFGSAGGGMPVGMQGGGGGGGDDDEW